MELSAGRRVALLAVYPEEDAASPRFALPNYGVRRIQAALLSDPALADAEVAVFESRDKDVEALLAEVEAFGPDVVGGAGYLWSLPTLYPVLRALKAARPERAVVLGGPSARPEMFARPPFDGAGGFLDALVIGGGEAAIQAIVGAADRSRDALALIPGLALHDGEVWRRTPPASRLTPLDAAASPYRMGLMPEGGFACLQSYFGCPLTCAYCAWGAMGDPKDVLSAETLAAELRAFRDSGAEGAILVDAALNLNAAAFKNLVAAEAEAGFFADATLLCELYPSKLKDEHMDFLAGLKTPQVSVGLQSYDSEVLARLRRPFDADRFEAVVGEVTSVAEVVIEIILGLPGDDPASFRRTFERLLTLPAGVRVYPCLALPDALMAGAPENFELEWDQRTLKLTRAWGWSPEALAEAAGWLESLAGERASSVAGLYWWSFDKFGARRRQPAARKPVSAALTDRVSRAVSAGSGGRWAAGEVSRAGDRVVAEVRAGERSFSIWMGRDQPEVKRYRAVRGMAFGYSEGLPREERSTLDRVIARLALG